MDIHELAAYREAGRIAADCRNWASTQVRPGLLLRELQEAIETRICDAGALPSFPAQTSRNEIAAHYCASPSDKTKFQSGDLVKIDLGAHIDGYPVDTGVSVDLSPDRLWADMISVAARPLTPLSVQSKTGQWSARSARLLGISLPAGGTSPSTTSPGTASGAGSFTPAFRYPTAPKAADRASSRG